MNWEHLWIVLGLVGMVTGIFTLGWSARIMWAEWQDDKALRAAEARQERHTHRKGDRQETVLLELPRREDPPWHFAGESEQGWAAEAAEYELLHQLGTCPDCRHANSECLCGPDPGELLHQTAELPEVVPGVDSPSDFEQSMTERVNEMIAAWTEQGNYDRHTMHEVG